MKLATAFVAVLLATGATIFGMQTIDVSKYTIVDLSHEYGPSTVVWPTSPKKFELEKLASGKTQGGYFYAANLFSMPEHGGTHLDAPFHFSESGLTTERIPLEQLVAPAMVIDVTASAAADRDYRATGEDVLRFEKTNGAIPRRAIVLLRTGWSRHWPNAKAYLGDDTPGDASKLSFPSFSEDAARLLVDSRGAAARRRHGFHRLRSLDGLHGAPHCRCEERPRAQQPHEPR